MQLSEIFLRLGEEQFGQLLRGISLGRLKTYQLFDRLKTRLHLAKLNTENLRKASSRIWPRLGTGDEECAQDLAQAILVSQLEMIGAVLDFLGIPNDDGFFAKDIDATKYLIDGWQERVFEKFRAQYPEPLLLFYVNHLSWELKQTAQFFAPAA